MLDDDAFQWFEDHGGMTRANGDRFRKMVLSRGNTEDLGEDVRGVAGRGTHDQTDAEIPRPRAAREFAVSRQLRAKLHEQRSK